jgi:hypothetical protein
MTDPSFYYAIFKKFQAVAGGNSAPGFGHVNDDNSSELDGGFSLLHTQDQFGLYQHLGPHAPDYNVDATTKLDPSMMPLNPMSNGPMQNPLFVMLKASLTPGGAPGSGGYFFVTVNNQKWPVMPPPAFPDGSVSNLNWKGFNTSAPLLFVASMAGDDGRRNGDHAVPDVPIDHVPPHFWNSSQIFLTDKGGTRVFPTSLKPGEEYYVAAIIGNAGNWGAGRCFAGVPAHMFVQADALPFNTFMGPNVHLPSLSNLDPQSINQQYEQYFLAKETYDVAGFRFNVDKVFAGLKVAMTNAGFTPAQLGGMSIDDWLRGSHACVKVTIPVGENANSFTPEGNVPLTLASNPRKDRHIAQRNLAPFDMTLMAIKKPAWTKFIVAQAGGGVNALRLEHGLPLDAVRVYLAIPRPAYERYIDPKKSKGGAVRGFEAIHDGGREAVDKPFPDAVILQQTQAIAEIHVADHARERFFGMALGIAGDPARLRDLRLTDVSMVHADHDGGIVGGFTLKMQAMRQGAPR